MTNANMIMDAVCAEIVKQDPDAAVYVNFQPSDFERPSHYIECASETVTSDNRLLVSVSSHFTVTSFLPVDEYGESDQQDLLRKQALVMSIFRKGYIRVGDRAIKVQASTGGYLPDRVFVDFQTGYFDDRGEWEPKNEPMDNIKINIGKG